MQGGEKNILQSSCAEYSPYMMISIYMFGLSLRKTIMAFFLLSWAFVSALLLLLLLKLFRRESSSNSKKSNLPPSPPKLPIIGNLHQLGKEPHKSLHHLSQKLGPIIYLKLGQIPTVVVSSAKLAKEAFKTHDLALSSRPQLYSAKYLVYNCNDIAFAPYGPYWRHVRKICILELLSTRRVQSFGLVREEEVASLIGSVACSSSLGPVNVTKELAQFVDNFVCRVTFGRNMQGLEDDQNELHNMLAESQILLGGFNVGDLFPSMEWIDALTGTKSKLQNLSRRFDQFFDEVIEKHLYPKKAEHEHKDLVDVLLNLEMNGSQEMPLTRENIKALIMDMLAAGIDTTFITLDWGMTELIVSPQVMKKAQEEVRSVLGKRIKVEESDLHQLHYLNAVVKEIFRLHPPTPLLLPRESIEEVRINGYIIPAKTRFFLNAWAIGRDPQSWENPLEFEPERFLGSSIDFKGQDFELIPFGTGRRGCPGMLFGMVIVQLALAQLLYSFDWELPVGVHSLDMTEKFGLTMRRISNLIVVAKPYIPRDNY